MSSLSSEYELTSIQMHCHISWHISEGLGVQFLEAPSQIVMPDQTTFDTQCANWKAYEPTMYYKKDDSGL